MVMHVGLRADEAKIDRGWKWPKHVVAEYLFQKEGVTQKDVVRILELAGLGLPDFYRYRSRSGCWLCPFQKRVEWVGLLENHPDLFWRAASYEKDGYSWIKGLPLVELAIKAEEIKLRHKIMQDRQRAKEMMEKCQLCFSFAS